MMVQLFICCATSLALVLVQYGAVVSARDTTDPKFHCSGVHPQQNLDLDQVLGRWYAVEMVQHRDDTKHPKGKVVVDACPLLHLTRTDTNQIKLLWDEKAGKLEYNFHIQDLINQPGYWLSYGAQNGSLLRMSYNQFAGTVEVTKAVGTHMVLTFCTPETELYSVVMSRGKHLPKAELRGVNRMLEHRELQIFSIRETCKDSASFSLPNIMILSLAVILLTKFS
ncbi:uncharacterized protein isoform X2 [Rhodnius prolixus]|uniref:uncharacterized protein isoform X2 n=1 Tax=Rhodnius prolixus TaxID=13249 RepID=UPI003D18797C